ncbi:MAG: serine hydrolase [Holosporales bacterium]|jgi:CubicO group peptidase (beta-lactamase class C family)|nr:serine hydrolase [Holosporales bacterium]
MLKIFQKALALLFALIAIKIFPSFAAITDEQILENAKQMEKIIIEGMKKIGIPAVAISIARKDKILYYNAFGETTLPDNGPSPVSAKTLFPVSSVSKNVTAILVGALVDEGKIAFEDKVRKYYPEFFICNEWLSNEFTIRDLISHSSGLKHFSADSLLKGGYEIPIVLNAFRYLKQTPGKFRRYYGYQNVVYGIVGYVLESATGKKYEDLVEEYIFSKMDMKNSSAIRIDAESSRIGHFKYMLSRFFYDKSKIGFFQALLKLVGSIFTHEPKEIVTSHSRYLDNILPLEQVGFFHKFPATSGISFSAEDYSKWISMLANKGTYNGKQIVSEKTFSQLTSNISEIKNIKDDDATFVKSRYSEKGMYYGMGFFKSRYFDNGKNGRDIIYHMGGIYGATAFIAVSPSDDLAAGVVCNLGGVAQTMFCEYMVNQFFDLCFGFSKIDWIQADIDRKNYYQSRHDYFHKNLSERNPSPMEKPEKYVGTYSNEMYGDIKVSKKDDNLIISNGIRSARLDHVNGDTFSFSGKDMTLVYFDNNEYAWFFRDEENNISSANFSCFDENKAEFVKIK